MFYRSIIVHFVSQSADAQSAFPSTQGEVPAHFILPPSAMKDIHLRVLKKLVVIYDKKSSDCL